MTQAGEDKIRKMAVDAGICNDSLAMAADPYDLWLEIENLGLVKAHYVKLVPAKDVTEHALEILRANLTSLE